MLDPAMQAFDAEMRTKLRPRRPASTRRAEQIDVSSAPGISRSIDHRSTLSAAHGL